ncbi:MAG: Hsp20 family protein [Dehalogenimonas sp.]
MVLLCWGMRRLTATRRSWCFKELTFEDTDRGYVKSSGGYVIPNKADLSMFTWSVRYPLGTTRAAPSKIANAGKSYADNLSDNIGNSTQRFLVQLGYQCMWGGKNHMAPQPAFNALNGVGEGSRDSGQVWPFGRTWRRANGHAWSPSLELIEEREHYRAKAELPGVKREDVDITVSENVVTIKGERKESPGIKDEDIQFNEIGYGAFSRSFTLPTKVDADKITALFENGMLELTLPKSKASLARHIEVKTM